jgi:hypothetical protein
MFLSDFSIKRPVATVVLIISLMALGLLALSKLRVNQIPDVEQPVLTVSINYPGASPDTVEREVINRIEKSLQGISGVDQVRSTAREGNAQLVLIFNFNKNMILRPSPSCSWRCQPRTKATRRFPGWQKINWLTNFAALRVWPWSVSMVRYAVN